MQIRMRNSRICRWERINGRLERRSDDRLSSLPDELLITILSLLSKPWEIVHTCLLSKRWRNLWTFVPCLTFKGHYFWEEKRIGDEDDVRFQNFVSSFLRLRDDATNLHTFTLLYRFSPSLPWISYALKHNPKILHLELIKYCDGDMPDCLFTCESLEDLQLCFTELSIPDTVFLPKLKKLYLSCDSVKGNCMDNLLFRCPVLESLTLRCAMVMDNNFSFHTVKKLDLWNCSLKNESSPSTFYISGPCLEFLKFSGVWDSGIKLKDVSKVKKPELEIHKGFNEFYNCEFLSSLENLTLVNEGSLMPILEEELPNCPTFINLKELTLIACCVHCDIGALSSFLEHCPNLEILNLFHKGNGYCDCVDPFLGEHEEDSDDENSEEIKSFKCERLRLIHVLVSDLDLDGDRIETRLMQSTIGIENVEIIINIKWD